MIRDFFIYGGESNGSQNYIHAAARNGCDKRRDRSSQCRRNEADDAIRASLAPNVRLDFGDVTFMDSSGIGFVLGRYRVVQSYGGNVEVVNLSRRLYSMMKLAGLEKLVTLKTKERERKKDNETDK